MCYSTVVVIFIFNNRVECAVCNFQPICYLYYLCYWIVLRVSSSVISSSSECTDVSHLKSGLFRSQLYFLTWHIDLG